MVVDVVRLRGAAGATGIVARARALSLLAALAGLVALSVVARLLVGLAYATPRLFPDEYIYQQLSRSLADGRLAIRGAPAHFPALLEPLASSPIWLVSGGETAYRLTQALHALELSLVAVPVFLLARRLRLGKGESLAAAALMLALPSLVFSAYVTADSLGLLLALTSLYVGTVALETRSLRYQALFLAVAGLATFARVQYAVLPLAFAGAALVVSRGNPFRALAGFRVLSGAGVLATVGLFAYGPTRALGYYDGILDFRLSTLTIGHWIATDALLLVYASGVVLVPVAVVGGALAAFRPAAPVERAFAALATVFAALLLLETGLYAANGSTRFQERYLIALSPLVPLFFFVGLRRLGRNGRIAVGAISAVVLLLAVRLPLSGFTQADGAQDSPFLQAVAHLEDRIGVANASLATAAGVGVLALLCLACAVRPRVGRVVAVAVALVVLGTLSAGASAYNVRHSDLARRLLAADPRWVDHARLGPVAVLLTPGSSRSAVSQQMFWNESLSRILRLRGADDVDSFGSTRVRIGPTGELLANGSPYRGPLLIEEYGANAELAGSVLVTRTANTALWRPVGAPRLVSLTTGHYYDGWFGWSASVTVWPRADGPRTGLLCLRLTMPPGSHTTVIRLRGPGVRRSIVVRPGSEHPLALRVTARSPWRLSLKARSGLGARGTRLVSVQGPAPSFVADALDRKASPAACR